MADALLADIGGTNARFALLRGEAVEAEVRFRVADFKDSDDAIRAYLDRIEAEGRPSVAAFAVAGSVERGAVRLTNSPWRMSEDALRTAFGFEAVHLVNDFGAIAWAVPRLGGSDLVRIGGGEAVAAAPVAVVGPGTGLGVAGYLPGNGAPRVLVTEGGHATMAPADEQESEVLTRLRRRFGHVSAERVLSGDGLVNLYEVLAEMDGLPAIARTAEEVTEGARTGVCRASIVALDMFCRMLGTFAGDVALVLGARGGVYLAGGILPRFAEHLERSGFRTRFESKGRFGAYLARVPTALIVHPDPAFLGLVSLLGRARSSAAGAGLR
jgi:glucokinase